MVKAEFKHWRLDTDADGIIWCSLDKQGTSTNVLSTGVLSELDGIVTQMETAPPRGLVIRSAKTSGFIAGADVNEFTAIRDETQALEIINRVHALFDRLTGLQCPTLALIHGYCLGGGLELALACRYRVALDDPDTRIGLPEVKLGIFPGFGGSARLVRLIGAVPALQMMLAGRSVDARRARQLGIVDHAVPERQLMRAARIMLATQPPGRTPGWMHTLANQRPARPLLAKFLRRELRRRVHASHYPAPYALVDLWEDHGGDTGAMMEAEAKAVARLIVSPTAQNLVRVYLLQDKLKSRGNTTDYQSGHVHVVGAGVMGGDIAAWCAMRGYSVTLQDREPRFIAPALQRAHGLYKKRLRDPIRVSAAMDRLIPDLQGSGVGRADVVIEAISENLQAKVDLFREIEPLLKADAILATNTSSIPLSGISSGLQRADRLVGIHFFNPVAQMQLVEIVYAPETAAQWITRAASFCRGIDHLPLPVKSSPGFLVNRVLTAYLMETVLLIDEGVPAALIDQVAGEFGMPMGPVELADSVGLDICLSVAENMAGFTGVAVPERLRDMVRAGRLGRKNGRGFYQYHNGKVRKPALPPQGQKPVDLQERLVLRILNECAACLREQLVEDGDCLDAGMVYGTGFAPFRGGPMHYAELRGRDDIRAGLQRLSSAYGDRFTPDPWWLEAVDG
jgi:3-hydroxyacyl-CoA dehydrogenase/enoyl-CoA hydratase/3-hydroxybutyryl-CoA epimerase